MNQKSSTLLEEILQGNRRSMGKAITLLESTNPESFEMGQELLDSLLPHTGKALRIGITGVPGVGKSTFIEAFGSALLVGPALDLDITAIQAAAIAGAYRAPGA